MFHFCIRIYDVWLVNVDYDKIAELLFKGTRPICNISCGLTVISRTANQPWNWTHHWGMVYGKHACWFAAANCSCLPVSFQKRSAWAVCWSIYVTGDNFIAKSPYVHVCVCKLVLDLNFVNGKLHLCICVKTCDTNVYSV